MRGNWTHSLSAFTLPGNLHDTVSGPVLFLHTRPLILFRVQQANDFHDGPNVRHTLRPVRAETCPSEFKLYRYRDLR